MFTSIHSDTPNETLFAGLTNGHASARADRWLADRLKHGLKEPFAEVVSLTPELAKLLLASNPDNRAVQQQDIESKATDILANRYALNGETIIVSKCGYLNDGQNRCLAVIASGKPIRTFIAFGVERNTRTTVDSGRARTPGDYLTMRGVRNGNNVAAVTRKLMEIERNGKLITGLNGAITKQEILERATNDDDIQDAVRFVNKPGANKVASQSILATAFYLFSNVDRQRAEAFMSQLIKGTELVERSPIWTAREKLLRRDLRLTANEQMKTIIMAWNGWRSGAKTKKSLTHSVRKGERLPEIRA